MEHREIAGIVQCGDTPASDRTQYVLEIAPIGDELRQDVPDRQGGRVLGQSLLTPIDDFFDCERHSSTD
jgi:hypothetical protein